MSNLVEHAVVELNKLGNDGDFDACIVEAVSAFAKYGHSGGSAGYGIQVLHDLLQFKPLSALTNHEDEWMRVGGGVWQSTRNPEAFSKDGGMHYYLLSEGGSEDNPWPLHKSEDGYSDKPEPEEGPSS